MNREIKFRVWDKERKLWVNNGNDVSSGCVLDFGDGHLHKYVDYELSQFTGLLDKNGKEIYEGDIVETGNLKRYNDNTDIAEIRWFRGGFMLHLNGNFGYRDIERYDNDSELYKVIGNIYENK